MAIIYLLIAMLATTIGAATGLGGGIIIKPALDALGDYNAFVIGVLSSAAILAMTAVSTVRNLKEGTKIDLRLGLLTVGAIAGGAAGKGLFSLAYSAMGDSSLTILQSFIIIFLLIIILAKHKMPKWHIKSKPVVLAVGLMLGTLSAFLGIGGGPFNVTVLCMFFAMDIKKAVKGSIFIILFSQIAKLITIGVTSGYGSFDYSMLYFMIPGGVAGGVLGGWLNTRLKEKHVEYLYKAVVIGVIILSAYNIVSIIII